MVRIKILCVCVCVRLWLWQQKRSTDKIRRPRKMENYYCQSNTATILRKQTKYCVEEIITTIQTVWKNVVVLNRMWKFSRLKFKSNTTNYNNILRASQNDINKRVLWLVSNSFRLENSMFLPILFIWWHSFQSICCRVTYHTSRMPNQPQPMKIIFHFDATVVASP